MSDNGKGDASRPMFITPAEYAINHARTFGKQEPAWVKQIKQLAGKNDKTASDVDANDVAATDNADENNSSSIPTDGTERHN